MQQYLDLMRHVLRNGVDCEDRTGTGTRASFGHRLRFDLADGFPLLTTKQLHVKSIIHELLWFLRGESNLGYLHEHGVTIWDEWADDKGELGPIYGVQWRSWGSGDKGGVDQITSIIDEIRRNPSSRRLLVSAWNVGEIDKMALPPCHCLFQFHVAEGRLSCQLYQRSADIFLGLPYNIASYSLLTMMMAQVTDLRPGEFIHVLGDAHLYKNHFAQARKQLRRKPKPLPVMHMTPTIRDIFAFRYEDFSVEYPGLRERRSKHLHKEPKLLSTERVKKATKMNPSPKPLRAPVSV